MQGDVKLAVQGDQKEFVGSLRGINGDGQEAVAAGSDTAESLVQRADAGSVPQPKFQRYGTVHVGGKDKLDLIDEVEVIQEN